MSTHNINLIELVPSVVVWFWLVLSVRKFIVTMVDYKVKVLHLLSHCYLFNHMAITVREAYIILDIHVCCSEIVISSKKLTFSWENLVNCFINDTSFKLSVKFLHGHLKQKAGSMHWGFLILYYYPLKQG